MRGGVAMVFFFFFLFAFVWLRLDTRVGGELVLCRGKERNGVGRVFFTMNEKSLFCVPGGFARKSQSCLKFFYHEEWKDTKISLFVYLRDLRFIDQILIYKTAHSATS
jgi:hypothetical protein